VSESDTFVGANVIAVVRCIIRFAGFRGKILHQIASGVIGFHQPARYADDQCLARCSLRSAGACEESWLHCHCHHDSCAGNRRDNHDLQRHRQCSAPFPYKNADRLATPSIRLRDGAEIPRFPVAAFLDFREQNHTFDDMIGLAYLSVRYASREGTEQVQGAWVTRMRSEFLVADPWPLTSEDGKPGSSPVFVMSYQLWVKQLKKDPQALGTALDLNGTPRTLIAVMPPRFHFGGTGEPADCLALRVTLRSFACPGEFSRSVGRGCEFPQQLLLTVSR
jgi:hypothetical protein